MTRQRFAWLLLAMAVPLTTLILLPVGYLFVRAAEVAPERAFSMLARPGTLRIMGRQRVVGEQRDGGGVPDGRARGLVDGAQRSQSAPTVDGAAGAGSPILRGAFALLGALGQRGIVQRWLLPLGVERLPSIYGFWGAWLALTLFAYPYVFLSARAGLRGIDPALEEASYTLGRSHLATFWRVTLPQLLPAISAGVLLVALYTLSDFGAVAIMR